jgi:hypothetical protein
MELNIRNPFKVELFLIRKKNSKSKYIKLSILLISQDLEESKFIYNIKWKSVLK